MTARFLNRPVALSPLSLSLGAPSVLSFLWSAFSVRFLSGASFSPLSLIILLSAPCRPLIPLSLPIARPSPSLLWAFLGSLHLLAVRLRYYLRHYFIAPFLLFAAFLSLSPPLPAFVPSAGTHCLVSFHYLSKFIFIYFLFYLKDGTLPFAM